MPTEQIIHTPIDMSHEHDCPCLQTVIFRDLEDTVTSFACWGIKKFKNICAIKEETTDYDKITFINTDTGAIKTRYVLPPFQYFITDNNIYFVEHSDTMTYIHDIFNETNPTINVYGNVHEIDIYCSRNNLLIIPEADNCPYIFNDKFETIYRSLEPKVVECLCNDNVLVFSDKSATIHYFSTSASVVGYIHESSPYEFCGWNNDTALEYNAVTQNIILRKFGVAKESIEQQLEEHLDELNEELKKLDEESETTECICCDDESDTTTDTDTTTCTCDLCLTSHSTPTLIFCPTCDPQPGLDNNYIYCPQCGTKLEQKQSLKDVLNLAVKTPSFIVHNNDQVTYQTTVGAIRNYMPNTNNHYLYAHDNNAAELTHYVDVHTEGAHENALTALNIAHTVCNEDNYNSTVGHVLVSLIEDHITEPMCRENTISFGCNINPFDPIFMDDTPVNLKIIPNQLEPCNNTDLIYVGWDKYCSDIWDRVESGECADINTEKQRIDKYLNDNRYVLSAQDASRYQQLFNAPYNAAAFTPVRSPIPSPYDTQLRALFKKIHEDVYFSTSTRQLYTLDELQELFSTELDVFDIDFKEQSTHVKILNVNVYILNDTIESLFELVDLRSSLKGIAKLRTKQNTHREPLNFDTLCRLLGLRQ
jgi:hypothetical protein